MRLVPVEGGGIPEIQAVCVVSKARAKRGKVFRMRVLVVQEGLIMRGRGTGSKSNQEAAGGAGVGGWIRVQTGG